MVKSSHIAAGIFILVVATACSKNSISIFRTKELQETGIDSTLIRHKDFTLQFTPGSSNNLVVVKYLGSGGFYFTNGKAALLVDPFFSPYPLLPLALKKISTQSENVEKGLYDIKSDIYAHVDGIFNTHSHYDHLLDVPYVFNHYLDTASSKSKIYGSLSMKAIVSTVIDSQHIVAIEDKSGTVDTPGEWIYINGGSIRVMPINTKHAPHYKKLVSVSLYRGQAEPIKKYNSDITGTHATDWKQGKTFAYLIDFMHRGEPEFRIYLLTSASAPPDGFIHPEVLQEHKVNLAILGAASFANVENYPQGILQHLEPEKLIIAHWEDLFKPYLHDPPCLIRATNFKKLIPGINQVYPWQVDDQQQFFMPAPGVAVHLQY
jgi:hypothetical protein